MSSLTNKETRFLFTLFIVAFALSFIIDEDSLPGKTRATASPAIAYSDTARTPHPTTPRTPMPTNTPAPIVARVTRGVNIREDASAESEKVGSAKQGEKLMVTKEYYAPKWHQILYNGEFCYVSANYTEIIGALTPGPTATMPPGMTSGNPIIISAKKLSDAAEKDLEAARKKYIGCYVKISGMTVMSNPYVTRSYDGHNYHYQDHLKYRIIDRQDYQKRLKFIPIEVTMIDTRKYYEEWNDIVIIGRVTSIDKYSIEITDGIHE